MKILMALRTHPRDIICRSWFFRITNKVNMTLRIGAFYHAKIDILHTMPLRNFIISENLNIVPKIVGMIVCPDCYYANKSRQE